MTSAGSDTQGSVNEAHPFLTPDRIERLGRLCAPLLLSDMSWVERRKEAVEILDDTALRRRISVDFSLRTSVEAFLPAEEGTGGDALFFAPAFVLPKSPANLMDFDLSDETGRALRLQSREDNANVSAAAIRHCARLVLGEEGPLKETLRRRLTETAGADAPNGKRLADELLNGPAEDPESQLERVRAHPRFRQWLWIFGHSSLCVVLYRASRRSRKLVRLSFTAPITTEQPWHARLGWTAYRLVIDVPLLEARTFHFEARSPTGLRIKKAVLSDSGRADVARQDGLLRRVHLYRKQAHEAGAGTAVLWLTVGGPGFLGGAVLASTLTVAALAGCAVWADKIAANPSSAPSLLLVLPGLIASYLARPDQHALTSRLLAGARYLLIITAGCAYVAAGWVALGGTVQADEVAGRESQLLWVLIPLAVVAAAMTAGLSVGRAISGELVRRLRHWINRRRKWRVDEQRTLTHEPDQVRRVLREAGAEIAPPDYRLLSPIGAQDGAVQFLRQRWLGSWFITYELREVRAGCRITVSCDYVPRIQRCGWILRRKAHRRRVRESLARLEDRLNERGAVATGEDAPPLP